MFSDISLCAETWRLSWLPERVLGFVNLDPQTFTSPVTPLHSKASRHGAWPFVTFNKKIRLVNFIYISVSKGKKGENVSA